MKRDEREVVDFQTSREMKQESLRHTICHVTHTVPISPKMRDHYDFVTQIGQTLTQLVDMHLNASKTRVEEVRNHCNDRSDRYVIYIHLIGKIWSHHISPRGKNESVS